MNKKVKNAIKKQLTPITALFGMLFLLIGIIAGYFIYKTLNKSGDTIIELEGENIIYIDKGKFYNEDGYKFIIDGVDYSKDVVVYDDINYLKSGKYLITYELNKDGHKVVLTRIVYVLGGALNG